MKSYERFIDVKGVSNLGQVYSRFHCLIPPPSDAIYRSARPSLDGYQSLKDVLGVKTVLNLQLESDHQEVTAVGMISMMHALTAIEYVPLGSYQAILSLIEGCDKPILIHCLQGHDRTGVICAAYRVSKCGWTLAEAIEEMKDYGFVELWVPLMESLKAFSKSIGVET